MSPADRQKIFASERPTHDDTDVVFLRGDRHGWSPERIEKSSAFWNQINRGEARYVVLYEDGKEDEAFFAGCSID